MLQQASRDKTIKEHQLLKDSLDKEVKQKQEELANCKLTQVELENQIAEITKNSIEEQTNFKTIQTEMEHRIKQHLEENKSLKESLQNLTSQNKLLDAHIYSLTDRLQKASEKVQVLNARNDVLETEIKEKCNELGRRESNESELQRQIDSLTTESDKTKSKWEEGQAKLEQRVKQITDEKETTEHKLLETMSRNNDLQKRLRELEIQEPTAPLSQVRHYFIFHNDCLGIHKVVV